MSDRRPHRTPLAAFADGPVADDPQPVATEPEIVVADPDGDDLDAVGHSREDRRW